MSRAELYQKLLKAAAKQLGVKATSEQAKDLAVLRLCRETITSKLISGRDVDPSALRWLVEELAKFAPPPETPRVELTIVEGITGVCPVCKAEIHPYEPPPTPPPSAPTPPPPSDTQPEPSKPKQPKPSNVVELRPHPPGIHDAPSARMAVHQEPWRGHVDAASDPVPDWSAAHSLPPIPPECFPK